MDSVYKFMIEEIKECKDKTTDIQTKKYLDLLITLLNDCKIKDLEPFFPLRPFQPPTIPQPECPQPGWPQRWYDDKTTVPWLRPTMCISF